MVNIEKFITILHSFRWEQIRDLNDILGIPASLSEVGVKEDAIPAMAADAMKSGNIAVNPRSSKLEDIEMLYRKAMWN